MSACFNLHQLRFQRINASDVEVVALIRRVYLYVSSQKRVMDRFLEQRINIRFHVKLGKNAKKISLEMKHGAFSVISKAADIPTTQESSHIEITNEDNVHHFLRYQGTVHFEFIPQGQTVNQAHYVEIRKRLREAVRRKTPELWTNDWILHHDNAPAHRALSSSFVTKNRSLK
jgi:hypothetical protein